ncbi:MAG: hypothetical protein ACREN1_06080 [Candidatus Dormibacteria bacterium]
MASSVKARASLALTATTALPPPEISDVVRHATDSTKGGGKSLLTTGVANVGAHVHIEREDLNQLALSITSGRRLVELCSFSAKMTVHGAASSLRVGGLERYKTTQPKLFYVVPAGPKSIFGYDLYRRFLEAVSDGLQERDSGANVAIAQMAGD